MKTITAISICLALISCSSDPDTARLNLGKVQCQSYYGCVERNDPISMAHSFSHRPTDSQVISRMKQEISDRQKLGTVVGYNFQLWNKESGPITMEYFSFYEKDSTMDGQIRRIRRTCNDRFTLGDDFILSVTYTILSEEVN